MDVVLALGGGGIKGVAQIPVLEALDDLGLRPTAIAGTSIGALVGAAYAAGFTGAELRDHVHRIAAGRAAAIWATIRDPRSRILGGGLSAEAVYDLGTPDGMPESFEALEIPFTAVTTDYYGHHCVPVRSGPLRPAVAASFAIPGLFAPIEHEGQTLVDGGLVRNLPMQELPPGFTVAVDVLDYPAVGMAAGRIRTAVGALQIMIKAATERELAARPPDLLLKPRTAGAGPMEFRRISDILEANEGLREELKRAIAARLEA